ncbi:MAG: TIGR03000 domain-containing protein, partial [Thermogemmata sp.]
MRTHRWFTGLILAGLVLGWAVIFGSTTLTAQGSPSFTPQDKKQEGKTGDKKTEVKKVKSKIIVKVPDEDAELKIEGKLTKPTGLVREFVTPEIEEGKAYIYEFTVIWRPNNYTELTRTKVVNFKGGDLIQVDLSKPDPNNPDKAKVRWVPTP